MISDTDRAEVYAGVFTHFLVMHRGFMINAIEDRLGADGFNYNTGEYEQAVYSSAYDTIKQLFSVRNINILKGVAANWNKLSDVQKYNFKKVCMELSIISAMAVVSTFILSELASKKRRDWWIQALSYLWLRVTFEYRALYNPFELVALLNTPSAAVSRIETAANMLKLLWIPNYFSEKGNPTEKVTKGVYKGQPKVVRNIIKSTPFHSIWEAQDPAAIRDKRNYLETQLEF
jgi:hypothetical protein